MFSVLIFTVWSQDLITSVILITEPGSRSQCTCIVLPRKFSIWGHLLFHSPATLPTHLHASQAFLSWASRPFQSFSFLTDPLPQLSSPQGLSFQHSFFLQSTFLSTLSSMQRMPCLIKSKYLFPFLFYNPHDTKHWNNISEWVSGAISRLQVTSEREMLHTQYKFYVLEFFYQPYAIFNAPFAATFLVERIGIKSPWWTWIKCSNTVHEIVKRLLWKDCL